MRAFISSLVLGAAALSAVGCTQKDPGGGDKQAIAQTGKLDLALEAVSDSGKVYRLRNADFPILSDFGSGSSLVLHSEDDPSKAVLEAFLAPGNYTAFLNDGWFVEQVDNLNETSFVVPAVLESSQVQFFEIRSDEESFVKFNFQVDGRRVTFGPPGRLNVGIGIVEREGGTSPGGLNPRRSLIETNQTAVKSFSLSAALAAIQTNSGLAPQPNAVYRQIIDSYASAANGQEPTAVHCGDETTDGAPSLNGFALRCDRLEAQQIDNLAQWFPIAAVNRVDLAPTDGANCGQQRLIFANNVRIGNSRMFMIIEAQIPNPHPECGVAACRPLADFWARQSDMSDAFARGERLAGAYLKGDPELAAAGFKPFLDVANLSVGAGSIRTNNFDDFEWTLRLFKMMTDTGGNARAIPFPVTDAPHGELWNDTSPLPQGELCRKSFVTALDSLLSDDPAEMAFPVDDSCYDAESPNDGFTQNYPLHLDSGSGTFRGLLETRLAGTGLSPEDIASRARFAGSCMGCHEEAIGSSLGHGVFAPFSNGFVQVDEQFTEDCGDGQQCFNASPALKEVFLPRRLRSLEALLGTGSCTSGGDATPPPPPGTDGGGRVTTPAARPRRRRPELGAHPGRIDPGPRRSGPRRARKARRPRDPRRTAGDRDALTSPPQAGQPATRDALDVTGRRLNGWKRTPQEAGEVNSVHAAGRAISGSAGGISATLSRGGAVSTTGCSRGSGSRDAPTPSAKRRISSSLPCTPSLRNTAAI
jgi:hypothetical protein